jgi:hypothetical protein
MRFQVPQFIEVEDKIFGPLTFKQFIYLIGGAGLAFILYRFLPIYISVLVILPVAAFSVALAFYKINNKPFIFVLQASIKYFLGAKLYIWKKEQPKFSKKKEAPQPFSSDLVIPKLSGSKLKDLAWQLDIHDTAGSRASDV